MGIIRIVRGLGKIVEGIAEGDIAKVGKGAIKTGVGVVTTFIGADNDDDSDDLDDD